MTVYVDNSFSRRSDMQFSQVVLNNPIETLFWSSFLSALLMGLLRGFTSTMHREEDF